MIGLDSKADEGNTRYIEGTITINEAHDKSYMAITMTVKGMSCGHCEQTVEEALLEVEGVTGASADRDADRATIEGDADPGTLVQVVTDAGYTARA